MTGLNDGPAFVFARKDGYRFTMARTVPGKAEVRITLLKAGELPPASEQSHVPAVWPDWMLHWPPAQQSALVLHALPHVTQPPPPPAKRVASITT